MNVTHAHINFNATFYRSIAIPAISTGVFHYPLDKATLVITEAVRDYFTDENPKSKISEVHLCDIQRRVVDAFKASMQTVFTNVSVTHTTEKSPWVPLSSYTKGKWMFCSYLTTCFCYQF